MELSLSQRRILVSFSFGVIIVTYLTIGLDSVLYPGFFAKYFLLDSRLLTFLSLALFFALFFVKSIKLPKLFSRLVSLNSLFILPSLVISAGILTFLERLRYPNFVFTFIHVHYDHLFYALLLSGAIHLFSLKKELFSERKKIFLLWASIFLLYGGLLMKLGQDNLYPLLSQEDGLFESLEFLFYLIVSVTSLSFTIKSLRKKDVLTAVVYGGFALLFFFIAGEEISWGQRIFNIASPDVMLQYNVQKETTLHNLKGIQESRFLFYLIFSSYFSFTWVLVRRFRIKIHKKLARFISPWHLSLFFIPMFFITLWGNENIWQEYCELLLSLGVFFYIFETQKKNQLPNRF